MVVQVCSEREIRVAQVKVEKRLESFNNKVPQRRRGCNRWESRVDGAVCYDVLWQCGQSGSGLPSQV